MKRSVFVILLLGSCLSALGADDVPPKPIKSENEQLSAAKNKQSAGVASSAMLQLALDFGGCNSNSNSGCGLNSILSPLSLTNALTMLMAGCHGSSYSQLHRALNYPTTVEEGAIQKDLASINDLLKQLTDVRVNVANGLFSLSPLSEQYRAKAKKLFAGEALMAFQPDTVTPDQVANFINKWVANRTENKITNIISQLNADTKLIVANAIYFNGKWADSFSSEFTSDANFTVGPGETHAVSTMFNIGQVQYTEDTDLKCKMIALPYKGGDTAMYFILPTEDQGVNSLNKLELQLNEKVINRLMSNMTLKTVSINLPKFKIEQTFRARDALVKKGVRDVFSAEKSNLSRMFKNRNESVAIEDVLHKSFIQVTETGTEAASATLVFLSRETPKKTFHADRPFIFFIRDERSGAVLFFGRLVRPESAARN